MPFIQIEGREQFQSIDGSNGNLLFEILRSTVTFRERTGDPSAVADQGKLYVRVTGGATELFFRSDDGDVTQLTGSGAGTSGWVDTDGFVRLATAADTVGVGKTSAVAGHKFIVEKTGADVGYRSESDTSTDKALDAFVTGDSAARLVIDHAGAITWGDGSGAGDVSLARGAANRLDVGSGDTFRISATGTLELGTDVSLSRGAADRLDLAAGDSFLITDGTITAIELDAATATVTNVGTITHQSSGTPAAGFGTGLLFEGHDAGNNNEDMVQLAGVWTNAGDGTEAAELQVYTRTGGGALAKRWTFNANGDLTMNGDFDLVPGTDSQGDIGTSSRRWTEVVAIAHEVYAGVGDAQVTSSLSSAALIFGPGGGTGPDTRIRRTAANTITFDDNLGGAALLVPPVDDVGEIGTDALRWNRIRTRNLQTGDLDFENDYKLIEADRVATEMWGPIPQSNDGICMLRPDGTVAAHWA